MPSFRPTLLTLLTFMFIVSILSSVSIISYMHVNVVNDFFEGKVKSTLRSKVLAIERSLNREISNQKALLIAVREHPEVSELVMEFSKTATGSKAEPPYPLALSDSESYHRLVSYFTELTSEVTSLEMLRIFWKDGYVLAGVVYGSEDIRDYKGDKGWFSEAISGNSSGAVYISPINVARHTNTPVIRYVSPIYLNGNLTGVIVANFNFRETFSLIKESFWEEGEHVFIVDPYYENAEGEVLGPRFIVNTYDPKTEFNESCSVCPLLDLSKFSSVEGFREFKYGNSTEFYGYYRWITLDNDRKYLIICAMTPESFSGLTNDIKRSAVLGAVSIGSVFMVASIFMSRYLLNPIDEIVRKARIVASGAYDTRVSIHRGYREAEVLSRAIKDMQESLIEYLRKTEEYSEGLKLVNSVIRHDTVNHLTAAMNYIEFYEETGEKEYLEKAKNSMNRVSETLRVSRVLEAVMETGEMRRISVADFAKKVAERYPELDVEVEGDCEIMADDGLAVVFDNLLQNALKHGRAGRVHIKISEDFGSCTITISDDGSGIPDDLKKWIFEKGFSTSGSGLGLFIVKLILSRYGGKIWVEDNEPKGARFIIKIWKSG